MIMVFGGDDALIERARMTWGGVHIPRIASLPNLQESGEGHLSEAGRNEIQAVVHDTRPMPGAFGTKSMSVRREYGRRRNRGEN